MLVRPPADHRVDGSDVEAPRGVELTDPKRPRGLPHAPRPREEGGGPVTAGARVHCVVLDTRTGNPGPGAPPSGVRDRAGGHGGRETPGPIPNPEVKPSSADGTARGSVWESRRPPDHTHHPRRGPGTPPRAPTPCGGTTIQQPHQHQTPHQTTGTTRQPGSRPAEPPPPTEPQTTPPDQTPHQPPEHDNTTNQTHRPDGADPFVHLCSSSHSSIGSLRSRAGRNHEQVIGSFERSGASS